MAIPGNVSLVTVTGTFLYIDGTPATNGTVTFRPSGDPWLKDASADATLLPMTVTCQLNSSGQIVGPSSAVGSGGVGVKLPATDDTDLAPNGFVYDVTAQFGTLPAMTYSIALPASPDTVDLADLAPVTPVDGGGVQMVLSVNGKSPSGTGAVTLTASDVNALDQTAGDGRYLRIGVYNPVKAPVALTDETTIATDASLSSLFRVVLAGNRTLGNPTGAVDGQRVLWQIKQDSVGGRTLVLGSKFRLGSDLSAVVLSTTAGTTDYLGAQYDAGADVWHVLALAKGY